MQFHVLLALTQWTSLTAYNDREYYIDAAISELNEDEVKNLKDRRDLEIIGTSSYFLSGECASVTTDFEGLDFFKSGSATGFTQRGVVVESTYVKGSESDLNNMWTNVLKCLKCNQRKAAESQAQERRGPCEQCKPDGWFKRCLCIKQKGAFGDFSNIGDSGAVVFEKRENQSASGSWNNLWSVITSIPKHYLSVTIRNCSRRTVPVSRRKKHPTVGLADCKWIQRFSN